MRNFINLKTLLISSLTMAAAAACKPEIDNPQPQPQPEPTTIKTSITDDNQLNTIFTARKAPNLFHEFNVENHLERTPDNMHIIGDVKKFDAERDDVKVNWNDTGMYMPTGSVVMYDPWMEETLSHKFVPNEDDMYPETDGDEDEFAKAGFPQIKNRIITHTYTVTHADARDLGFLPRLAEQYPTGFVKLLDADSLHVMITDLHMLNTDRVKTDGRFIASGATFAVIRGDKNTLQLGYGPGTTRSGEIWAESVLLGTVPEFQWKGVWPEFDKSPLIVFGAEWLADANMFTEYTYGNSYSTDGTKGEFPVFGLSCVPYNLWWRLINAHEQKLIADLAFGWDIENYGLAVYQDPELLAQMKVSIPVGGFDAMDNGSATADWLRDTGIIPCKFPEQFRHKSVLAVIAPNEYGTEVVPFELPMWIQEAFKKAGHARQ